MSGLGQSLGAALGQFAFGSNTREKELKGALDGARAFSYDAAGKKSLAEQLKAEAERRMLEQQEAARSPDAMLRNAITQYSIPEDDMPAVEQYRKTGQLGGRFAPSIDGMGPVTPQPEWAKNLPALGRTLANTQRALTLGDKSVENVAKADLIGRESSIGDDIIAGRLDPLKVSQSQFALKGTAPFKFEEFGTGNQITGKLDETTGAATRFGEKRKAETKAQQANAVQSYAAAGASNASAAKTRQEREQGASSGQTQIVTDSNGNVTLVNKVTGLARPATYADGKTVGAKVGAGAAGTEGERNASGYADRMTAAERLIQTVGTASPKAQKPGFVEQATGGVGMIANTARSEERQQYRQAQEDWVRAKLRKESGAAIPNDEMEREITVYFPQISDGPKVIKQKVDARKVAEGAMRQAAGRAQSSLPPQAEGGSPPQIKNDAEYSALPSGTEFVAPDGSRRRKP